jgi:hypothetical protein
MRGGTGLSLHIGLNHVDPDAYDFFVPPLAGCINDADDMRDLAGSRGFRTRQLLEGAATSTAVVDAIRQAAQQLQSGDIFLISYSGHGSQVPDPVEDDHLSETWVLWDRQLIDDELYALWSEFREGVRVVAISDSCHSGTVSRRLLQLNTELSTAAEGARTAERALGADENLRNGSGQVAALSTETAVGVALALAESMTPVLRDAGVTRVAAPRILVTDVMRPLVATGGTGGGVTVVEMPRLLDQTLAERDVRRRETLYREVAAEARRSAEPRCRVLLLAACQDNQTASDGRPDPTGHQNGAFTRALRDVWQSAADYRDLYERILARMPSSQTPNLYWATPRDPALEGEAPFTV